jgi:nucleotide-binding universal stress UspA family protein
MQTEVVGDASQDNLALEAFRRILVPVEPARDDARYALGAALELKRRFGSELLLVTFTEFGENEEWSRGLGAEQNLVDLENDTATRLRRFVENVAPEAVGNVSIRALEDNEVPRGIERCVSEWGATLVVLTTHGHPGVFRARYERIIQNLDVPVLLLRPPPPTAEPRDLET